MERNSIKTIIKNEKASFIRFFDSPKELVFEAWSSHEHLSQWWGPDGFTLSTHSLDFIDGGIWIFTMHGPDGRDYQNRIKFIEIRKPDSIIYEHSGDDGVHFHAKVLFKETKGGTNLEIEMKFPGKEELERIDRTYGAIEGAIQHITRLGKYIHSEREEKKI